MISRALRDAVAWKYIPRNPAGDVTLPKAEPPELQAWSAEQLRAFLTHVHADRLYPRWLLAVTTGMRRGELIGLRWTDLDLDAGKLTIRTGEDERREPHYRSRPDHRRGTDLRSSYITAAIEAGVPPQVIAARVGHANTNITMNLYARVIGGAKRKLPLG